MKALFKNPLSDEELEKISTALSADELVVIPTETVYGLAGNAFSEEAVKSIFRAKLRPATNPVIVHIADFETLLELVADVPKIATLLADAFWPGPLTMVFKKSDKVPSLITAYGETVGVRIPKTETTLKIIRNFGPIAAPSANLYTEISPTSVDQLNPNLLNSVTYVVDAGPTEVGIESTVLSVVDNRAILLRPGMISKSQIEKVIGKEVYYSQKHLDDDEKRGSPGLAKRHYAPKTKLIIGLPTKALTNVAAITLSSPQLQDVFQIKMPNTPTLYAARLYSAFHELDPKGYDEIFIEEVPDDAEWDAIRDRIRRAAFPHEPSK